MRRANNKALAAAPAPLPRRVVRSRFGAGDWRRRLTWLCGLAAFVACLVYLERTKVPLPVRASTAKDSGPSWAEMLRELQALHTAGVDGLRRGTEDGSALEAYNALSQEQRVELLSRGVDRLRQEPLILRLAETPAEAHELLLKIAPELEGIPGSASFDVTQLLTALLDGTENNGMLPPVAEPADRSAAAVAQHQVALLRHEIRSTILSKFAAHVLLPEAAPQVEHQ